MKKNIGWYDNKMLLSDLMFEQNNGNCFDDLLFNKSWDWLMIAVERIEDLSIVASFEISQPTIFIFKSSETSKLKDIEINSFNLTKLEAVYKAVVEFINSYN